MNKVQLRQAIKEIILQEIRVNKPRAFEGDPLSFPEAPLEPNIIEYLMDMIGRILDGDHGDVTPTGTYSLYDVYFDPEGDRESNEDNLGLYDEEYDEFIEGLEEIKGEDTWFEISQDDGTIDMNDYGENKPEYIGYHIYSVKYANKLSHINRGEELTLLLRLDFVDPDNPNRNPTERRTWLAQNK